MYTIPPDLEKMDLYKLRDLNEMTSYCKSVVPH